MFSLMLVYGNFFSSILQSHTCRGVVVSHVFTIVTWVCRVALVCRVVSHVCTVVTVHYAHTQGAKYLYTEDWGENLVDKKQSVMCVLDLTSDDITILEDDVLNNTSCGQVWFCYYVLNSLTYACLFL